MEPKIEKPIADKPEVQAPDALTPADWFTWLAALDVLARNGTSIRGKSQFFFRRYVKGDRSKELYLAIHDPDTTYENFFL